MLEKSGFKKPWNEVSTSRLWLLKLLRKQLHTINFLYFAHTPHVILENFYFRSQIPTFEFIPSVEEVFDTLVPQYIKGEIYGVLFTKTSLPPTIKQKFQHKVKNW